MSNTIDQRTVEMVFDNSQFEKGVEGTIKSLESLDKSLDSLDSGDFKKNIEDMGQSAAGLDQIADQIEGSKSKIASALQSFSGLFGGFVLDIGDIGKTIWSTINSAFNFQGGMNRALNIENAKFQLEGLKVSWKEVSQDINYAVEDTAYGFDSAAKAAAQFAASQVALGDDMKYALRGISGVAAMTNSSYDDIANVFTRIAGQGRVMANDLNSLAARGLNAAATLAEALHTDEASIRDMVSAGEIGFQQFAKIMDEAFGEHSKKANETFNGALSNMNAAWSRFWALFLGGSEKVGEGDNAQIVGTGGGILNMLRRIFLSIKQVVGDLVKVFTPIAELLQPVTTAVGDMAENIANFISGMWIDVVTETVDGKEKVTRNVTRLGTEAFNIFRNIGAAITSFARPIIAFVNALLPTFDEFYNWASSIKDVNLTYRLKLTEGAVKMLETAFAAFGTLLKNIIGPAILGVTFVLDKLVVAFIFVKDFIDTVFDTIWDIGSLAVKSFTDAIGEIQNPINGFLQAINSSGFTNSELFKFLEKATQLIDEFFGIIEYSASNSIRMPWDKLGAKLDELARHLFGFLDQSDSKKIGSNLENNFYKPIINFVNGANNLIKTNEGIRLAFGGLGKVVGDVARGIADALTIVFGAVGTLTGGILNSLGFVWDVLVGIKDGIVSAVSDVGVALGNLGTNAISGFLDIFGIEFAYAAETASDSSEQITESFSNVSEAVSKSPVEKLVTGIGDAFNDFGSKLRDNAPTIEDWSNLFGALDTAIGDFVKWLDPIGRMQSAIATIKEAFKDFGTKSFVGWGTKFLDAGSPIASLLDTISTAFSNLWKTIQDNLPTSETIADLFDKIGGALVWIIDTVSPLVEGMARIAGTLGETFVELLSRIFDEFSNMEGLDLDSVGNSIRNLFEGFNEFSKSFANGDFDIFGGLVDSLSSLGGFLDPLTKLFLPETAYAAEMASDTVEKLGDADISRTAENVSNGGNMLADAVSDVSKKLGISGINFEENGEILVNAFKWVQDNLGLVVGIIAGGVMYIGVFKALKSFRKMSDEIGGVAKAAKGVINGVSEKLGLTSKKLSKIQQLRELIVAIMQLAITVALLSFIPADNIKRSLIVVGILAGIIVAMVLAMSLINKHIASAGGTNYMGIAAEISAIATAILLASASLFLISMVPIDKLKPSMFALLTIMLAMTAISVAMGSIDGNKFLAGVVGLALLGAALLEFTAIIIVFTIIPWSWLTTGILAVVVMLAGLITAASILHKFAPDLLVSAAGLLAITAALYAVVGALILLDQYGGEDIVRNTAILITTLGVLVVSLLALQKFGGTAPRMLKLAASLVIVASALAIIAASISAIAVFSGYDTNRIIAIAASLGILFAELAVSLGILSKMTKTEKAAQRLRSVAATLVVVSVAMGIIGAAISSMLYFGETSEQLLTASLGLTIAFTAMSVALGVLAKALTSGAINPVMMGIAAAGLIAMSTAMFIMASALNEMANVSWDNVLQIVVIMGILVGLGALAGHFILIAVGVIALGAAMLMAGAGVHEFAIGISLLAANLPAFADAIDAFLSKMIVTMQEKFPQAIDVFIENLHTLADKAPEIMESVTQIIVSIITGLCDAIIELVPTVADSLVKMMESAVEWMSANSGRLENAVTGFAGVLGQMIGIAILAIPQMLGSFIQTVVTGIGDMLHDKSQNMANKAVSDYVDAYSDAVNGMSAKEIAAALAKMNPQDLKIQGSVSIAGVETSWDGASESAQRYAAILDRIYKDPALKNQVEECEEVKGGVDAIAASYQAAMGTGPRWVESTNDVKDATDELNESVNELHVEYGNLGFDFNSIFEGLKGNEVFSKLNLDGEQFSELLNNLGGEGGTVQGLMTALGDATALEEGLVQIIGQEGVDALANQGLSIEMIQGALANATADADKFGVVVNKNGEEAYYTLQDIHAALADGVDVSAALKSMESLRQSIYDLRTAFNSVNVVATAAFNLMSVKVGAKIAETKTKIGTLPTYAKTMMTRLSSNVATGASGIGTAMISVGKYMVAGFVTGITYYRYMATNAGKALARAAKDAAKKELDVESPSKVFFEIGKFVAIGFGNGIYRYSNYASDIAGDMGSQATKSMRSSLADISEMVDGIDWDAQPVIRPVLDTSNVEAGWSYISGLMGRAPTMQAAYAGPRNGRVISSNSSRVTNVSIDLHYQAGTDGAYMADDIAKNLAMKLNLEA